MQQSDNCMELFDTDLTRGTLYKSMGKVACKATFYRVLSHPIPGDQQVNGMGRENPRMDTGISWDAIPDIDIPGQRACKLHLF